MMFVYCLDNNLKQELLSKGYKLLKDDGEHSIFILNKNSKFNFDGVDKTKYAFTNKLTF